MSATRISLLCVPGAYIARMSSYSYYLFLEQKFVYILLKAFNFISSGYNYRLLPTVICPAHVSGLLAASGLREGSP